MVWPPLMDLLSSAFVIVVGSLTLLALLVYIHDKYQTKHTILRNYPLIGRFRYGFEYLGRYFRQYLFADDRSEKPFNRAQRSWIYKAAKNINNHQAFGSTRDANYPGKMLFLNTAFPTLEKEKVSAPPLTIGSQCKHPYHPKSIYNISGMSFGALSKPAVQALSLGAKQANCWINTGEGGVSPYHLDSGADLVVQIGTAKYGVRDKNGNLSREKLRELARLDAVKMFEIKMSQGAKPGKGGILPADKVTPLVAGIRGIAVNTDSISPNRHPELSCASDVLDMVHTIRITTCKPVGIKFVMGDDDWIHELARLIIERGLDSAPDFITIDGAEGGTGAAPMSLMDDVGLPLQEALPRLVDILDAHHLRPRIKVIASGKLVNPTMVAWALAMGADFSVSARGFMFALGCVQAMSCNNNDCPTGITTHNKRLQRGLVVDDKAARVRQFHRNLMTEVEIMAHACGLPHPRAFERKHVHMVTARGPSVSFEHLFPSVNRQHP